jgi:hypothetical protein
LSDDIRENVKEVKYQRLTSNFQALSTVDIDDAVNYLRKFVVSYKYIPNIPLPANLSIALTIIWPQI